MTSGPETWRAFFIATLMAAVSIGSAEVANDLPRKGIGGKPHAEAFPGVEVLYDSVSDVAGHRLRLIVTHPKNIQDRVATIFVVGWLSCDSVEAPLGTTDPTQLIMQALAKLPQFALVRMDKEGVGDSEGDCAATDFVTELDAYRRAFRKAREYPFVDTGRLFLFGISNGGGFAPLVAEGAPVRGYVTDGGWIKTWFEHMLEIERRRLALEGHPPSEINGLMKSVERLYSHYLLDKQSPRGIFEQDSRLAALWSGDPGHQYGRPIAYYQQLQDLDLMAAWSAVKAPALVLHGEFDWIMSEEDLKIMTSLINRNSPGAAEFVTLSAAGHSFEHVASMQDAFSGKTLPFDERISQRITYWFEQHK